MERIALTGLIKIEFPGHTVLLCDGGFKNFDGDRYLAGDPVFGVVTSLDALEEGVGDEVPALDIELSPPSKTPPSALSQPGFQRSRARFWIAEYDAETNTIVGTPDLQFDGQIDQTSLRIASGERSLPMTVVSTAERLFERNLGNGQNASFHKKNNPGELGHDSATGLKVPIAWGAEAPRAEGAVGGGRGSIPGLFGRQFER